MPERNDGPSVDLTRREAIGRVALFGTVMAILQSRSYAQNGAYSNSAIALPEQMPVSSSEDDLEKAVKIARAVRSGPSVITRDATVAEMDHRGTMTVLRQGNNGWICTPGNENRVGDPPMCVDELGMQWFRDAASRKPAVLRNNSETLSLYPYYCSPSTCVSHVSHFTRRRSKHASTVIFVAPESMSNAAATDFVVHDFVDR